MTDRRTISVYNAKASEYAAAFDGEVPEDLRAFAALLPTSGAVLDLGCGPGGMAGWLADQGFDVTAWDASEEMVRRAALHPRVTAQQALFEDLDAEAAFDGVWASFSLLHAPRADLPRLIGRIARAVRSGGVVYVAMKLGSGASRDALGRSYSYVSEGELRVWLEGEGLDILTVRLGQGVGLAGTDDPYVTMTARKGAAA